MESINLKHGPKSEPDNPHTFLRLRDVAERTAMGASTVLAWEKAGKFPKAVRLSPGKRVWLAEHVNAWICDRAEGRHAT